jgi:hypothetical protein
MRAKRWSLATVSSVIFSTFPVENPTVAGDYKNTTLALLFQAKLLTLNYVEFLVKTKGPFEYNILYKPEQPGPDPNQTTTGSFLGLVCEG